MIIKRIKATNLKGRSFAHDLTAMNVIVGDNFTGKTSIIDAIRLCLIGHIPELGKTNAATWQLSSGEKMGVELSFDNDTHAALDAWHDGNSVKITAEGREPLNSIPLLNAAAYFAMSERERYEYVFGIAKLPESFTTDAIIAECERISFEEEHTEAIEKAKGKIINLIRPLSATGIRNWLSGNIEALKVVFTQWNQRSKDTQGAVRVLTELKNRQDQAGANAQQCAEAERCAQADAEHAYKALLELRTQASDYEKHQERTRRVDELKNAVIADNAAPIVKRIEEAKKMLKPKVQSKVGESDLEQLESHLARLTRGHTEAAAEIRNASKALDALKTATQCPYCHSTGDDWKKTLRAGLKERLTFAEGKLSGAESAIPGVQAKVKAAKAEIDRARADLANNRTINANILTWESQLETIAAQTKRWQDELDKETKALSSVVVKPVTKEESAAAALKATQAKANLVDASAKMKAADALEHDLKRAAQSEIEHRDAVAFVAVIKKVLEVLRSKQSELVDTVFADLLEIANLIAGPILATPLAFHEGEVGRWDGHRWISHKTFSGTEQALTFVAIAAALSQGVPLRLLIFDELGRLDRKRRGKLMDLLRAVLDKGFIDQFIVAGAVDLKELRPSDRGMAGINLIGL